MAAELHQWKAVCTPAPMREAVETNDLACLTEGFPPSAQSANWRRAH